MRERIRKFALTVFVSACSERGVVSRSAYFPKNEA